MKFKDIVILHGLVLWVLGSCSKNETTSVYPKAEIVYNVISTKAASVYDTNCPFISNVWYVPDGVKWGVGNYESQVQHYISDAEISYIGGLWRNASTVYYWPKDGSLTFMAYSPSKVKANVSVSSANYTGIQLKSWDVHANQDVDFMVSDVQSGMRANDSYAGYVGVPTIFRHKLSKLVAVRVTTLKDYSLKGYKFYLKNISIGNYSQQGSYVSGIVTSASAIGQWTVDKTSEVHEYVWYNTSGTGTGEEIIYDSTSAQDVASVAYPDGIMLLPQQFDDPGDNPDYTKVPYLKIKYDFYRNDYTVETKEAIVPLYDVFSSGIQMNKTITLTIKVSDSQSVIYWAPQMDDWSDKDVDISI